MSLSSKVSLLGLLSKELTEEFLHLAEARSNRVRVGRKAMGLMTIEFVKQHKSTKNICIPSSILPNLFWLAQVSQDLLRSSCTGAPSPPSLSAVAGPLITRVADLERLEQSQSLAEGLGDLDSRGFRMSVGVLKESYNGPKPFSMPILNTWTFLGDF